MADQPLPGAALERWCRERAIPIHEARPRFVEFVILECIAANPLLAANMVFKGGNALRFFYRSPRSTVDLDFTVSSISVPDDKDELRQLVDHALLRSERYFNVKTKCQRLKRNPPGERHTRVTYSLKIGYQFPGDPYYLDFPDRNVSTVIPVEISFHDIVCETSGRTLESNSGNVLLVSTIEDIVAEKLRALLQQPIRGRYRKQDVYDISRILRDYGSMLDRSKVAAYLVKKAEARDIYPRRSQFDGIVREMAFRDYDLRIREQTRERFIEFDQAWNDVVDLVNSLDLPQ